MGGIVDGVQGIASDWMCREVSGCVQCFTVGCEKSQ